MNKTKKKKMNKVEKNTQIYPKPKILVSNFMMYIMKMEKLLKTEKFIIFAKIWTEKQKLS